MPTLYHLKNEIIFKIITFDKNFYEALKSCQFEFIESIYSINDLMVRI